MAKRCVFYTPGVVGGCEVLRAAKAEPQLAGTRRALAARYCLSGQYVACPVFQRARRGEIATGDRHRHALAAVAAEPRSGAHDITFGPVPSRRLGRSVGVNTIAAKVCSYSCCYCQLGRTRSRRTTRQPLHDPRDVLRAAAARSQRVIAGGGTVDFFTFVADGEPTLDRHLGEAIELLRPLGIPVAVITNGSLLWRADVRESLLAADWVSIKVDTACEATWRQVNRPHHRLSFPAISAGVRAFAQAFKGTLVTETMLLDGVNDSAQEIERICCQLRQLSPQVAYLAVPTRPPAEAWARPAGEQAIARAHEMLRTALPRVELLLGYEGDQFSATGNVQDDLLGIVSVHPMREVAIQQLLLRAGARWDVVAELEREGRLVAVQHGPHRYYLRPIGGASPPPAATSASSPT